MDRVKKKKKLEAILADKGAHWEVFNNVFKEKQPFHHLLKDR